MTRDIERGKNLQEAEHRVQNLHSEKQAREAYWEEEITDRLRVEDQVQELKEELRHKKVKIEIMKYAFKKLHERFKRRVF